MQRGKYNSLKLRTLAALEKRGWIYPAQVAVLIRFFPIRNVYPYLRRLWRWKLLDCALDVRGLLVYRINKRGTERLAWLRRLS